MSQVAKIFQLNRQGFNLRRGVIFAVVLGLLIIVGVLPAERRYFLSAIFGAVCLAVSDPGGKYGYRAPRMAVVALAGALLTALGFGIGAGAWGFVVLAAFVATLLGGLAVKYGLHRFVAAYFLNVFVAERRVSGTVVGAAVAALVLLAVQQQDRTRGDRRPPGRAGDVDPHRELRLVHRSHGRGHLIAADVPHPSNLTDEGRRILFTFAGVAIAVIVMFLADRAAKAHCQNGTPGTCPPAPAA